MEKPTVTVQEKAACYLLGGGALVFSLIMLIPTVSAPEDEKIGGWIFAAFLFVCGIVVLGFADSKYIIDENGIYYKGFSKGYRYAWTDVIEVGVAKVRGKGHPPNYHPEIYITLKGGTPYRAGRGAWIVRNLNTGIQLSYRRKVWDCICHYYGAPDFDEWGKPPEVT